MTNRLAAPQEVVGFWRDAGEERWFERDPAFDEAIRNRFLATHDKAARGEFAEWESFADGALALVLLLDQFPRNMFRGAPKAYATDRAALSAAGRAIERGHDTSVEPALRRLFYLPFMHSEEFADQERSVALNEAGGGADAAKWARHHRDIVARFGRFPHRNAVLGRESTEAERAFLAGEESSQG